MSGHFFKVLHNAPSKKLLDFVSESLGVSKKAAKKIIDAKLVFINGRRVWMAAHQLIPGDEVIIYADGKISTRYSFRTEDLLLERDEWFIFNKSPGITSNGENSLEFLLRKHFRSREILAVHRLDKDTSGCLLFARAREAFDRMVDIFRAKSIKKTYHAICLGSWSGGQRTIETPIDGRSAISKVRSIKKIGPLSLLEIEIETGRTHQIRKHLQSVGFPVLGDKEYANKKLLVSSFRGISRQMLHAYSLEFEDPYLGEKVSVCAPYQVDFESILSSRW